MELYNYIDRGGEFGDFPEGDLFPRGVNRIVDDIIQIADKVPSPIKGAVIKLSERIIDKVLTAASLPKIEDSSLTSIREQS